MSLTGNLNLQIPNTAAAVTKSDTTDITGTIRLYVGGTGNLVVTTEAGDLVTFSSVPAGFMIDLRVSKVMAATTATNIIRFYNKKLS